MPVTLLEVRTQARSRLDEVTQRTWDNYELNTWINDGARDVARRAENIQQFTEGIPAYANMAKYVVPQDVIRIHRVEFKVGNDRYVLTPSTYQEMDQYWGTQQMSQYSYPQWFVLWGSPPNLYMQLYPVPSQNGQLVLFYYRHPVKAVEDNDIVEIPEGWHDVLTLYCEYNAKRRDRDTTWQEAKQLYEETLASLIVATRQYHDQSQHFIDGNTYAFEDF